MTLRPQEEGAFGTDRNAAYVEKIRAYLTALPPAPLVIIKEPNVTALPGLWFEAARQAGFDVAAVIPVRHPQEIVGSLASRANKQNYVRESPELTLAWWLKSMLLAERYSRGIPRVFVDYAGLLEDWRQEIKRIASALMIDLDTRNEGVIDEFLTADLHHHRHIGPVYEPFGGGWMSAVYEQLHAAAGDEPVDEAEMDRLYEAYRVSEHGFRMAFEDYRRYRILSRLMLPSLVRLSLGALALVHRRRGTWG